MGKPKKPPRRNFGGRGNPYREPDPPLIANAEVPNLLFVNDGPELRETNYWDTEIAAKGIIFVTWNAGMARVLIPDAQLHIVPELATASQVIVSRGYWVEHGVDAHEFLFDDDSDEPYMLTLGPLQTDRQLPEWNQGGGFSVSVWTRRGRQFTRPGKYRIVEALPCLQKWVDQ